ncbi:MAG: hypothetical protein QME69_02760 [Candidatus Saccharicenans sp.]|nr:hypothetical protein [Candidatus Saccharicenans sp.]
MTAPSGKSPRAASEYRVFGFMEKYSAAHLTSTHLPIFIPSVLFPLLAVNSKAWKDVVRPTPEKSTDPPNQLFTRPHQSSLDVWDIRSVDSEMESSFLLAHTLNQTKELEIIFEYLFFHFIALINYREYNVIWVLPRFPCFSREGGWL